MFYGGQSRLLPGERRTAGLGERPAGNIPGEKGERSPGRKDFGDHHSQDRSWEDGRRIAQCWAMGKRGRDSGRAPRLPSPACHHALLSPKGIFSKSHGLEGQMGLTPGAGHGQVKGIIIQESI